MEVAVIIISQGKEIDIMPQNYNPEFKKKFVRLRLEEFRTDHANQKWCTDFTHLFLKNGEARYNCSILDLYDRRVMASVTDHQRPRFPIYIESVCGILANLSMWLRVWAKQELTTTMLPSRGILTLWKTTALICTRGICWRVSDRRLKRLEVGLADRIENVVAICNGYYALCGYIYNPKASRGSISKK